MHSLLLFQFFLNLKIKFIMKKYVAKSLESFKVKALNVKEQTTVKGGSKQSADYTLILIQP